MTYRERQVTLVGPNGSARGLLAWLRRAEGDYALSLTGPAGHLHVTGADLFTTLTELRRRLEPDGWAIAVQGARPGAGPSGTHPTRVRLPGDTGTPEMLAHADPALLADTDGPPHP